MEKDHTDTQTENTTHEILSDSTSAAKQKKVRKPKPIPHVMVDVQESPHINQEPSTEQDTEISEPQLMPEVPVIDHAEIVESAEIPEVPGTPENESVEESEIPPIKQIRNLLTDFEMRVPVWGLTVFTVDGYILAHRLFYDGMPENLEMIVSSMSAGLITISQDFIRLVNSNSRFRQVLVDADDDTGNVSFSVMLKHIAENVMLTCIFPSTAKLGLVAFEIENLSNDINEIVSLWDVKLHEETVT